MPTIAESTTGQVNERHGNAFQTIVTEATTARTVGASDLGALIYSTAAGATTVTIPDSTVTAGKVFPIGSWFEVQSKGAGGVTVAKTGSDTLTGTATLATGVRKKVVKVAATEWAIA